MPPQKNVGKEQEKVKAPNKIKLKKNMRLDSLPMGLDLIVSRGTGIGEMIQYKDYNEIDENGEKNY